jgi:mycofactocin system creatininase family protein
VGPTDLAARVWSEAATGDLLAVPLGSLEQHGPHLPLDTDSRIALELVRRLAGLRPGVVIAPTIAYGSSGEHESFPGTISIGQEALELVLIELVRSANRTFEHVLLVSGHGGNAAPLKRSVRQLRSEGRSVLGWTPAVIGGDAHAGRTETAIMLALAPADVRLADAQAGNTSPLSALMPELVRSSVRAVSPNGVLGDPAGASAAEGAGLIDRLVGDLAGEVERWLT